MSMELWPTDLPASAFTAWHAPPCCTLTCLAGLCTMKSRPLLMTAASPAASLNTSAAKEDSCCLAYE